MIDEVWTAHVGKERALAGSGCRAVAKWLRLVATNGKTNIMTRPASRVFTDDCEARDID
jgi:hypothetical protein